MRCVNIDWLEVYVHESPFNSPCNADYFRSRGIMVRERDYGTRIYREMFTLEDEHGEPWLEVRRNPANGDSSFTGLSPFSCHLRLTNRACYYDNPVSRLRDFLLTHDYQFKRIYRIDVCMDFEKFDSGDDPAKFCRRYLASKISKINQCRVAPHGLDNWNAFDWQQISWGARKSMVSTKLYCKTEELKATGNKKPYIPYSWMMAGLIDNPLAMTKKGKDGVEYSPSIWRVEFSMKSDADRWLIIESQAGKRTEKKAVRHTLDIFDSRDKLLRRFEDLSFHYFRFKIRKDGVRKDRCPDKVLFRFNQDREVYKVSALPAARKPDNDDTILLRRLRRFQVVHQDPAIKQACGVLIDCINQTELRRYSPFEDVSFVRAFRAALRMKTQGSEEDVAVLINRLKVLIDNGEIF